MESPRPALAPCLNCRPDANTGERHQDAGPCCDERCLENVALWQCSQQCGADDAASFTSSVQPTSASGESEPNALPVQTRKRKRAACNTHIRTAYEQFAATLEQVGCLCKVLTARKLPPCCGAGRPAQTGSMEALTRKSSSSLSVDTTVDGGHRDTTDSCRAADLKASPQRRGCCDEKASCSSVSTKKPGCRVSKADRSCSATDGAEQPRDGLGTTSDKCGNAAKNPGCCTAKIDTVAITKDVGCCSDGNTKDAPSPFKSCAAGGNKAVTCAKAIEISASSLDTCGQDKSCCAGPKPSGCKSVERTPVVGIDHLDVEKGSPMVEHVLLDVQGLTCVGCETKLFRALQGIPGVFNLRTSLVLSQAEFDIHEKAGSAVEVIRTVEKSTGFGCQRLNTQGQEIDISVHDAKVFLERKYPHGITEIVTVDKHTVRIRFDAKTVGVRTLVETSFNESLTLATLRGSSELETGRKHVRNTALTALLSAVLTIPVLVLAWAPLPPRPLAYGAASLVLATAVQILIAGPFYPSALRALIYTHVIEMDLLIVLSTSTAYVFSIVAFAYLVAGHPLSTGEFFETSTLLVTLIVLGRLASAFARQRAVELVSIRTLQSTTAMLCSADGHGDREIDARLLQYGDHFKVVPDSRITTDGVIVSGITEVDESMVTGESLPVEKHPGSAVIAGSLNGSGVIVVRLTHLPGSNTISTIASMIDEAKFSKPKTQELADVVASYFVPVILALTTITFAIWAGIGIGIRHDTGGRAVVNAITYAISVLIVSCPCAIGLAVPMVIVIAGGVAAKHGVIFKSAMAMETACKATHVVFDKTGTLTRGQLSVLETVYLCPKDEHAGSIALGLTSDNKHPVSVAIATLLKAEGVNAATISDSKSIPGKGVEGKFENSTVRCGNTRWLCADTLPEVQKLLAQGLTVFGVAIDDQVVAVFGLSDSLRPESRAVITTLQERDIDVSIVSGDDPGAVEAIATELGIPTSHVRSRCTPGDKQKYIQNLIKDEKNVVIFCGDGTNDAVALAQASIGVHMSSGSDVAKTAADVVLVRPHLGGLLVLLDLSKAALRRVYFNFAWSFVYNLFAILLATGAFVHARIPPQYAGLGEIVSVLPVILIALHLRWFKRDT